MASIGIDTAPYVMTVLGPVDPAQLGFTLTHEHLYIDTTPGYHPNVDRQTDQAGPEVTPLTRETAAEARWDGRSFPENVRLTDIDLVVAELGPFREAGGCTIVDVTPVTLGRSPAALAEISTKAGIHVVMGSSFYTENAHPPSLAGRETESIADEFVAEIRDGVGSSGIRPGIMGEIGTSDPVSEAEVRILRAHAWAHHATGVPLTIHQAPWARHGHKILDVLEEEGVGLDRVVLGHVMVIDDLDYQKSLLERGALLSYDFLGSDHAIFMYGRDVPPGHYPPNDFDVVTVVASLVQAGFAHQILLSGDIGERIRLRAYGSWGYGHVPLHVVPLMRDLGISDADVDQICAANPRRLLTITPAS